MFEYNKEENVLYAYQSKFREPIPETYKKSPDAESYHDYIRYGLKEDIKEYLMPAIRRMCGLAEDDVSLSLRSMTMNTVADYRNYSMLHVKLQFESYKSGGNSEYVTVLKLPVMDDFGVMKKDGSSFCCIKLLEQDEVISYEAAKRRLKIKVPKGDISIKAGSKEPTFNISRFKQTSGQKNFSALNVLFAMCETEGVDAKELYNKFMDTKVANRFNDGTEEQEQLNDAIEYLGGNTGSVNASDYFDMVIPAIKSEQYDVSALRSSINKLLSLDRALGKVLDEPVVLSDGERLPIGTHVTRSILNTIKASKVTELYVKDVPNMLGYYTAEMISIPIIRRGTKIIPAIKEFLPDETGMYATKTYVFKDIGLPNIYIPESTLVSEGFLEMLSYNGFPDVLLKQREDITHASRFVKVNFRYEILNNHHHEIDGKWYYVNEQGGLEDCKPYLTSYDIAALISLSSRLFIGCDMDVVENADLGFRKRIVLPGELFHRAFLNAIKSFEKKMNYKFKELWNSPNAVDFFIDDAMQNNFYALTADTWSSLRKDYRCIENLDIDDKTNPVSYISALTKVVTYVKNKNSVADSMRLISLSQYGRMDAYESPQSRKLGVVNNLASGVIIKGDKMYTSYRRVMHMGNDSYITDDIVEMSVEDEENYRIADLADFVVDSNGKILNHNRVLCRVPENESISKQTVNYVDIEHVDFVNVTPTQFISWATATVPLMGANDAVRVNFGIAQTKAAKGLVSPDVPRLMTSANKIIPRLNTNYCIFAEKDGTVIEADGQHLIILYDGDYDVKRYYYDTVESALYSCTVRTTLVKTDERFKKGQMLMTSNFVKDGFLAIGVNALVCYQPNGFNYEDGNYASTRLCNRLTSYRVNHGYWENSSKFDSIRFTGISKLKWASDNDPLFTIQGHKGTKSTHDRSIYPEKIKGFLNSVEQRRNTNRYGRSYLEGLDYTTVSIDSVTSGDKLTNRHGNKGVVPQKIVRVFEKNEDSVFKQVNNSEMPRLSNGVFIDLVYNPLGVGSRMNTGQCKEANIGLCCHVLDTHVLTDSFNCISNDEIAMLMSYTYDLANEDSFDAVVARYPQIPIGLHEHCRENISKIRLWKGVFDKEGYAYLILPKNGCKETETRVLIGVETIYKLVQESDKKIHVRGGLPSGEPYLEMTNAPTKSAANKGGQRMGTMEFDALAAYGASNYMWELQNLRGDNGILRNNMNVEALHAHDGYEIPDNLEVRRSSEKFMACMLALGCYAESDRNEIPSVKKEDIEKRYTYTAEALMHVTDTTTSERRRRTETDVEVAEDTVPKASSLEEALRNARDLFKRG